MKKIILILTVLLQISAFASFGNLDIDKSEIWQIPHTEKVKMTTIEQIKTLGSVIGVFFLVGFINRKI